MEEEEEAALKLACSLVASSLSLSLHPSFFISPLSLPGEDGEDRCDRLGCRGASDGTGGAGISEGVVPSG